MAADVLKVSQKTAFLVFLAMLIVLAPVVYAYVTFSGRFFTASPDWWASWLIPTAVGAVVLGLASVPVFRKLGANWAAASGVSLCVIGLSMGLMLWYVPMMLSIAAREQVIWPATVASTERSGKDIKCAYPFAIDEIWQGFCAASAEDYARLRKGRKIEIIGLGNKYGMFIEGYRLAQ